ncbi:hypothetical protein FA13DRAFT_557108 [Coprinellus micaceus]|uniref:Uncharacterized protein n=1 Tax=Coprinellus micaceus TaxID=71717 RepID=A0A4Y7SAU1_COPMI|nr:hypothetical protein FA13DRAFT_557108 [Coprinellus micaceus]
MDVMSIAEQISAFNMTMSHWPVWSRHKATNRDRDDRAVVQPTFLPELDACR